MRIGIDVREFYKGKMTGIGRFIKNFLLFATDLKPDWKFILFGNQFTEIPFKIPCNCTFKKITEKNVLFWDQVKLPRALKKNNCDILFSPYYKVPIFSPIPSVATIHDLIDLIYPEYVKGEFFLKKIIYKIYTSTSSIIITGSENSKKDISRVLGISKDKIEVVYNSIDINFFKRTENLNFLKIAQKYKIDKPYLLYVGNANPHKNVVEILKAYELLPDNLKRELKIVLTGVGDFKFKESISNSLIVIKKAGEDEIVPLYANAKALVFPSFYEGFGFPPLEAMACGCPVLSSNAPCMPEILGDACLYFDPYSPESLKDVICKLIKDPGLRENLVKKGLKQIEKYNPVKITNKILQVLNKLAKERKKNQT